MKHFILSILNKYRQLKIKKKLTLTILFIMVGSLSFLLIGFQYAFHVYDQLYYQKTTEALHMSSKQLEKELKSIEEVSFSLMTDNKIQTILSEIKLDSNPYQRYQLDNQLWDLLTEYVGSSKYIHSIHIFDANGREYRAGGYTSSIISNKKEKWIEIGERKKGANQWVTETDSNKIFAIRKIRTHQNLSLDNLGTLLIQVNVDKIVEDSVSENNKVTSNMMISGEDNQFFYKGIFKEIENIPYLPNQKVGYEIQSIGGQKYFITHTSSSYVNWVYWNIVSFDSIIAKVQTTKYTMLAIFFLLNLVVLFMAIVFSSKLTKPIEQLVSAMKNVQKGDLSIKNTLQPMQAKDEIGILTDHFILMIERINTLIKENYEKQLLIKDTEFKALQAQINPHFLYNTLESINWQAKMNRQTDISSMVESLGYLLRNAISAKHDAVLLEEEIFIVDHYIRIQKYRYGDRLIFHKMIPPETKNCYIPKLMIQPLVENAIHYALEQMIEPCKITVHAVLRENNLHITVEDNGPGMEEELLAKVRKQEVRTRGTGIGLYNIDSRIKLLYGEEFGLIIKSKRGTGTQVHLIIPNKWR
ncbi:two-component sensor histidine kinase [Niallia circulans]|uniref:sensor histidine kinase n=1 Tax=Niallia circulans TaxID=1397 RepID=UPI00201E68EB|nr:sensor histidine kinase [Niallia circulans]UQZ76249.1 two-component sensor histidine kinase [Niallia circulans]